MSARSAVTLRGLTPEVVKCGCDHRDLVTPPYELRPDIAMPRDPRRPGRQGVLIQEEDVHVPTIITPRKDVSGAPMRHTWSDAIGTLKHGMGRQNVVLTLPACEAGCYPLVTGELKA